MSDSAELDYVSRIDYSKGFQRFHVKWPLNNLAKPKESSIFETTVTDGNQNITFSWSLGIHDSAKSPTNTWFGAYLKNPGKRTPMNYRICLTSSTNVLFERSGFLVFDGGRGFGNIVSSSEMDAFPTNNLLLQFWMDFPNAIAIDNNSHKLKEGKGDVQGQDSMQKECTDVLLFDQAKIFNRVLGAGPDPLSDFAVIMVDKNDEELRRFNCHSIFLSGRSDVFERMFALEQWKENSKDGRSVRINDIGAQVMEIVLRYIYTSTLPDPLFIDHDRLCGIIFAADKYNLKELKNWCVGVMIHEYNSIERRIEQLILADRHNLAQLKSVCIDQMSFGFSSVSDRALLKEISIDLWADIMKDMSDRQTNTAHIILIGLMKTA